ncbi:MAG: 3-deoxy-7-phosphoheptulonate synthase [Fidelibacterota bacterium]|nr:MAG: 3-deoxy-7-phosphoheptulonate synthase [Candidatus Neomarinimicrobiota bacterium]
MSGNKLKESDQSHNHLSPNSLPFKLASRGIKPDSTVLNIQDIQIGGSGVVVMAGPCAVESLEQLLTIAKSVQTSGASILRGGAFKPRKSPYSFQGLEEEGLKLLARVRKETGICIITEVMDTRLIELVCDHADILQIGSRNMHNFALLKEVGLSKKPVLLKRGMSATIEEFLLAAEYILKQGNHQVILCERGIRTFETSTRNTLDLSAVPMIKNLSHLPVVVDPSHGTGHWWMVPSLAKAAIAVGADGLLVEVHSNPQEALSDGAQSLRPDKFDMMMKDLIKVAQAVGREITLQDPVM